MEIQHSNITDQVYAIIRGRITENEIRFGARLHIRNLARELGVSPTPVHEALNRLLADGLATSLPRRSTFVIDPDPRHVQELCGARLCLETHMATLAVACATEEDVACLVAFAQELEGQAHDGYQWKPTSFHRYYAGLSRNRVLMRWHQQVLGPLNMLFTRAMVLAGREALLQHAAEELRICAALGERDLERLTQCITLHTRGLEELVLRTLFDTTT